MHKKSVKVDQAKLSLPLNRSKHEASAGKRLRNLYSFLSKEFSQVILSRRFHVSVRMN